MTIAVIDYGMGNLRSVSKAIEHLGGQAVVTSDAKVLQEAEKMVLPGVGAFGDAMQELNARGLTQPILDHVEASKPMLGICLGLQLFFESSEESPQVPGLGIFPGTVKAFDSTQMKVPHMGWNTVKSESPHPMMESVGSDKYFYFVHSYYAAPADSRLTVGSCTYGKTCFAAVVGKGSTIASQFHPEKSQECGLQILKNFVAW